jgi:hypothetical protein
LDNDLENSVVRVVLDGVWSSSDEAVFDIDSSSGVARAVGLGSSSIMYKSESVSTFSVATVVAVVHLSADLSNIPFVTNYRGRDRDEPVSHFVPISFYGGDALDPSAPATVELLDTPNINQDIDYLCSIDEALFAVAAAELHPITKRRGCRITALSPSRTQGQEHLSKSSITLHVSVSGEADLVEAIPYVPAFWVMSGATGAPVTQVKLSLTRSGEIIHVVHGCSAPAIRSHDPSLVAVVQVASTAGPGTTSYEISVLQRRRSFANVIVEVYSEQTQQQEIINVSFSIEQSAASSILPEAHSSAGSKPINNDGAGDFFNTPLPATPDRDAHAAGGFWASASPAILLVAAVLTIILVHTILTVPKERTTHPSSPAPLQSIRAPGVPSFGQQHTGIRPRAGIRMC